MPSFSASAEALGKSLHLLLTFFILVYELTAARKTPASFFLPLYSSQSTTS